MRCDQHRIGVEMRLRTMASLADDPNKKRIHGSHMLALPYTDFPDLDPRHCMLANNGLHSWVFKNAIADHMTCSAGNHFLSGLKEKFDGSLELIFQTMKN